MKKFILVKVHSCAASMVPEDLAKGLTHVLVLESSKKIGEDTVPDFVKAKSMIKVESGEHLLEVEIFNIGSKEGGKVQTYYRVLRKSDIGGKK